MFEIKVIYIYLTRSNSPREGEEESSPGDDEPINGLPKTLTQPGRETTTLLGKKIIYIYYIKDTPRQL